MTKLDFLKKTVSVVVGLGVTKIVSGIISNNVVIDTNTQAVTVHSASFVIGMAAGDSLSDFTDAKIDEAAAWWDKNVTNRPK